MRVCATMSVLNVSNFFTLTSSSIKNLSFCLQLYLSTALSVISSKSFQFNIIRNKTSSLSRKNERSNFSPSLKALEEAFYNSPFSLIYRSVLLLYLKYSILRDYHTIALKTSSPTLQASSSCTHRAVMASTSHNEQECYIPSLLHFSLVFCSKLTVPFFGFLTPLNHMQPCIFQKNEDTNCPLLFILEAVASDLSQHQTFEFMTLSTIFTSTGPF